MVYKAKSQKKIQGHWRVHSHWYEHKLVIMNGLNWKHNQVEETVMSQNKEGDQGVNTMVITGTFGVVLSLVSLLCVMFGFSTVSLNRNSHVTFLIQSGISNITKTEI